jgi:hypothetical protein
LKSVAITQKSKDGGDGRKWSPFEFLKNVAVLQRRRARREKAFKAR